MPLMHTLVLPSLTQPTLTSKRALLCSEADSPLDLTSRTPRFPRMFTHRHIKTVLAFPQDLNGVDLHLRTSNHKHHLLILPEFMTGQEALQVFNSPRHRQMGTTTVTQ